MVATVGATQAQDKIELSREARRSLDRALLSVNTIFRPSVTISKGSGRGSGTVFASYPGETLILTAAHVAAPEGPLAVEIQPYNLGIEDDPQRAEGTWPRRYPAEVVAQEVPGDVAIVRMRPRFVMPYVARIATTKELPEPGQILMSVGVDAGSPLDGWRTDVRGTPTLDIGKGGFRPFITTNKPPVPGRSGGGLFLPDGAIVGVCVGRLSVASEGRTFGSSRRSPPSTN